MQVRKQFHVVGRLSSMPNPRVGEGLNYDLGSYDSRQDAEAVRRERLDAGWGRVWIVDCAPRDPENGG